MAAQIDTRQFTTLDEQAVRDAGVSWEEGTQGRKVPDQAVGANFATRRHQDLVFSVKRKIWRQEDESMESTGTEYQSKRSKVLINGNNKCVFCGFRSKHTEVHHCNNNHADNGEVNLTVADPYCHGTQHIGQVGALRQGVFILLAGLPQAEVNHLQRTIAIVLEMGGESEKVEARALLQHLASRAELIADEQQGWGSANPSDFANALSSLHEEDLDKRVSAFAGMVLLYRPVRFMDYVSRWVEEIYQSLPMKMWSQIYDRARTAP